MGDFPGEAFAGSFPASPNTPGQATSRIKLLELLKNPEKPEWWNDYLELREEFPHFKNWRIYAYIAWASMEEFRQPKTKEEFAKIIGNSSRAIRKWEEYNWGEGKNIKDAIAFLKNSTLFKYRRSVLQALADVAKRPDPKAHNDRKLFLEMTGDYRPGGGQENREQAQMENWLNELREAA